MQRKRTITPSTFVKELCPSEIINMKILSALQLNNRQRYFHETWDKKKPLSDDVQRIKTVTPFMIFAELYPFEIVLGQIYNFNTINDIFMTFGTNIKHHQNVC